jgi:hypothetical protein
MTTRQPLRHLTLKHMALIKERLGHVAASHPKQFFILPGFFAQLFGSKRGRVVAMATKNLIIFQQELQVTVIISLACYVATARVRCTIQYLPKVPEWKVGKREKWKVRVPLFSYFPLLPFFPSGLFSEDSVAKKVNNRGKHFFLIQGIPASRVYFSNIANILYSYN